MAAWLRRRVPLLAPAVPFFRCSCVKAPDQIFRRRDSRLICPALCSPPVPRRASNPTQFLDMPHNSAIVMWAGCQERYKHGVPSMAKGVKIHPISGKLYNGSAALVARLRLALFGFDSRWRTPPA